MVQLQSFPSLYQLLSAESSIVLGPDLLQQIMLASPVANILVVLQLACGSPLMDSLTTVPTLQEALADTSGLPVTHGQLPSHGAMHTLCTANKMHIDSYMTTGLWYVQHKRLETHDSARACLSCNTLPQKHVQLVYCSVMHSMHTSCICHVLQWSQQPCCVDRCYAFDGMLGMQAICNVQHIHRVPDSVTCCSEHWLHKTCRQYSFGACQLITAAASLSQHLA